MSDQLEMTRTIDIPTAEAFEPMFGDHRFKGLSGGRGSAKSHFFADLLVDDALRGHIRAACLREIQNSIKDSVKQLIEDKINLHGVADRFKITDREIVGPHESLFIFRGLRNHTVASIKSLEGFNRALVEEAQTISQRSLDIMIPTFRSGSQMCFAWNPENETDPVDKMFLENRDDPDFCHRHVTFRDNPWFPDELRRDMRRDRSRDIDKYNHTWLGKYQKNSEARVFKNWQVSNFDVPANASFLHGADWGYSIDPTVLVRGFIGEWQNGHAVYNPDGKTLFITHEAYKVGVEIDYTPALWDSLVPMEVGAARDWPIIADSENPQSISYMSRHGYPRIRGAIKGPGSIKEGILFLQGYDIVVHPRCKYTKDELTYYCYKTDPLTGLVVPILSEKKNHVIDSLRYMVEPIRKPVKTTIFGAY